MLLPQPMPLQLPLLLPPLLLLPQICSQPHRSSRCHHSCQLAAQTARATPNHTFCSDQQQIGCRCLPPELLPLLQICCPAADDTADATTATNAAAAADALQQCCLCWRFLCQCCCHCFSRYCLTQPSYREVGVHFKRVGDIKVSKRSVKSYVMILSGWCAVVGDIFTTALS